MLVGMSSLGRRVDALIKHLHEGLPCTSSARLSHVATVSGCQGSRVRDAERGISSLGDSAYKTVLSRYDGSNNSRII
jgi:hypothetical protein